MNNDLISRSELKSVFENECFWCANREEPCDRPCWCCINEKIDNAPTVKFSLMPADETKEDAYKRGYEKGKIEGLLSDRQASGFLLVRDYLTWNKTC